MSKVRDLIHQGRLSRNKEAVSPYHQLEYELSVQDGYTLQGSCVVVPPMVIELLYPGKNQGLARFFVW